MTGFVDGQFITQYAIRMPSGELWGTLQDSSSSMFGGLFPSIFSSLGGIDPAERPAPPPSTFHTREQAQAQLEFMRRHAATYGIHDWHGTIVQRICSPFTTDDPAAHFAADIETWLQQNGGTPA